MQLPDEFDVGCLLAEGTFGPPTANRAGLFSRRVPIGLRMNTPRGPVELLIVITNPFPRSQQWRFTAVGRTADATGLFDGLTLYSREDFDARCDAPSADRARGASEPVEPGVGGEDVAPHIVVSGPAGVP